MAAVTTRADDGSVPVVSRSKPTRTPANHGGGTGAGGTVGDAPRAPLRPTGTAATVIADPSARPRLDLTRRFRRCGRYAGPPTVHGITTRGGSRCQEETPRQMRAPAQRPAYNLFRRSEPRGLGVLAPELAQ